MQQTPDLGRRLFCGTAAVAAASTLGLIGLSERSHAMTQVAQQMGTDGVAIRSFHVNFPESELTELRRRINATRWPERETVSDDSQGVQLATTQALARYWAKDYDWRKCEARLNALPPCAVGLVRGSMIFICSMIEPGHPCVTMSGSAFSCLERTWMK